MIQLDGSLGEGGGQVLRSALSLSMVTGQPFRIAHIRARRPKPGLMRQHLVAVQAAALICGAQLEGAVLGSQELYFAPGAIMGGDYQFAIGSAGSCTLVLQTVLPALLHADARSSVRISGGTHNPMAPPAHFLQRAYAKVMAQMGFEFEIEMERIGFFPAGGGVLVARVQPCTQLRPLTLMARGDRLAGYAESLIAGVPLNVARRELECVGAGMGWTEPNLKVRGFPGEQGPGNVLLLTLEHEFATEVFASFGQKAVAAEEVAKQLLKQVRAFLASGAAVGEHLADQLLLPMALAGGGSFTASHISQHTLTNASVIERFLPVRVVFEKTERMHVCKVESSTASQPAHAQAVLSAP